MSQKSNAIPTKEEVKKLLSFAAEESVITDKSIGHLLDFKYIESLMPQIGNQSQWSYDEFQAFFELYGIKRDDSCIEALEKLK